MNEPFESPIGNEVIELPPKLGAVWMEVEGDMVTSARRLTAIEESGYVWTYISLPPGGVPISDFQGEK